MTYARSSFQFAVSAPCYICNGTPTLDCGECGKPVCREHESLWGPLLYCPECSDRMAAEAAAIPVEGVTQ